MPLENTQAEKMLSVVGAAAIGRSCSAGNKADVENGSSRSSSSSSSSREGIASHY